MIKYMKQLLLVGVCVLLLCSCAQINNSSGSSEELEVSIFTTSSDAYSPDQTVLPSDNTNVNDSIYKETGSVTDDMMPSVPHEPLISTQITESTYPDFELPEEFFLKLGKILSDYSVNVNCLPDSVPCGCLPEQEQTCDQDGNVIVPRDRVMSIYYRDEMSGYEFSVNGGVHYPIASTIKIPFCVYVYEKIENGEIDPELVLTYEKRHYFGGSGVIVQGDFGQQLTVLELLKLAITRSDNVAYEMLKDIVSWEEITQYVSDYGVTHEQDLRKSKQKICLESAAAYAKIMKSFLVGGGEYSEIFKQDLLNTRNKMIRSHYPVYRKYGWTDFAFHDIAEVDAPYPYTLIILSNLDSGDNAEYELFREISYLVEEYSQADRQSHPVNTEQ